MSQRVLLLLAVGLFLIKNAHAALDDLENKLRQQEAVELRWDNIEGTPFWVSGPKPSYDLALGFHLVTLSSQEPVTVRLTKESYLRIHSPFQTLTPNDVAVLTSNGSGLFVPQTLLVSGKDLILPPLHFGGGVIQLRLTKGNKKDCQPVALFVSRYEPPAPMAPYRDLLSTCAEKGVLLSHTTGVPEESSLTFIHKLNPSQPTTVQIEGPVRLNLLTHFVYGPLDTSYPFMYRVNVFMDGCPFHTAEYIARPDDGKIYYEGLTPYLLSYANINPIEIPKGVHKLVLESNAKLFFQLQGLENNGYVFPCLNGPCLENRPIPPNKTALELSAQDVKALVSFTDRSKFSPSHLEQIAIKLGKDNFWKTNGAQSIFLLEELSQKRPDALDLKVARDKTDGLFTFYRDLLPTQNLKQISQEFAWTVDWKLRDPRDEGKPTFVLNSQKDSLLEYLVSGFFLPISHSSQDALMYTLPKRTSPSYLRLLVNQSGLKKSRSLWVQYDRQPAFQMIISCQPELSFEAYKPTPGLTGLSLLNDPQNTLGGLFNVRHIPAPLLPVGSAEIPLPADVKEVRVWNASQNEQPLELALQYQTSSPYRLTQPMMLEELCRVQNPEGLFFTALKFVLINTEKKSSAVDFNTFWSYSEDCSSKSKQSVAELYNHWLKLLRLLTFRHQKFIEGYANVEPIFISPLAQKSQASSDLKVAEVFAAKGQDWEAFHAWSHLLHSSNVSVWRKAHLGRIIALQNLGETYLSTRYLKSIFLKTKDKELRDEVFNILIKLYKDEKDFFSLTALVTEHFLKTNERKDLTFLSQVLLEDKEEALAIDMAHIVDSKANKFENTVIFAALKNNRARNGERLGEKTETVEDSFFWNAQLDQINGNYEGALEKFNKAGPKGELWRDHLVEGLTLRQRLFACNIGTRMAAIEDWIVWTRNHPGPRTWQPANYLVNRFYQATTLYSDTVDGYSASYLARPKKPIQLKLIGPAHLQFQVRVIFNKDTPIPYQGWVEIKDNGQSVHLPIVYTYPSEGLEIIGYKGRPSISEPYEISVGPGEHLIEILPQDADIIVEPFIKTPLVSLAVLPPVTHRSLALILEGGMPKQTEDEELEVNVLQDKDLLSVFKTVSANPYLFQTNPQTKNPEFLPAILRGLSKSQEIKPYPLAPQEQEILAMAKLLWDYEKKPSEKLLSDAQQFWRSRRQYPNLSRLWVRFTQLSLWTPIETPQRSAGIRSLPKTEHWEPDAPELALRKDLIEEDPEDYVLTESGALVFQFYNEYPTHVKINSVLANLATDDLGTVSWAYQIDNGQSHAIQLLPKKRSNTQEVIIPEGEHSLKFFVENPVRDTFIRLKLSERTLKETVWRPLTIEAKKDYLLATKNEPVQLDIEGPAWIRVDEWVNGQVVRKDYHVEKGKQTLKLLPTEARQEGLFRVFRRIARAPAFIKPRVPNAPEYVAVEDTPLAFNDFNQPNPICGKEVLPLGGQEDGTWSLTTSLNRVLGFAQNNLDGLVFRPDMALDKVDKYAEERATYRYFDEINRMYWKGAALVRERKGNPTLGVLGEVQYSPINMPLTFWGAGSAYSQHYHKQHLRSGTLVGGIRHKLIFTEKADQKVNLSILGRKLHFKNAMNVIPFNPNTPVPSLPDRDVFSQYLATHGRSLNFDYKFYYRPFMDQRLRAEFLAVSNPKLNLFNPDSITGRWGIDQLIGEFILSADYAITHFYKNTNQSNLIVNRPQTLLTEIRPFPYNRNLINGAITWNHWLPNHQRLECRLDMARVFDSQLPTIPVINQNGVVQQNVPGIKQRGVKQWVAFLSFTWHFGNGRDFRDFDPEEIVFKDLRERHLPPVQTPSKGGVQ